MSRINGQILSDGEAQRLKSLGLEVRKYATAVRVRHRGMDEPWQTLFVDASTDATYPAPNYERHFTLTVADMMFLMPAVITEVAHNYDLEITNADLGWGICYLRKKADGDLDVLTEHYDDNLCNACYFTLEWLLQNRYIGKHANERDEE